MNLEVRWWLTRHSQNQLFVEEGICEQEHSEHIYRVPLQLLGAEMRQLLLDTLGMPTWVNATTCSRTLGPVDEPVVDMASLRRELLLLAEQSERLRTLRT